MPPPQPVKELKKKKVKNNNLFPINPTPPPVKEMKKDKMEQKGLFPINHTDIVMGFGGGRYTNHPGNQQFRRFCWDIREAYGKAPRCVVPSCLYPWVVADSNSQYCCSFDCRVEKRTIMVQVMEQVQNQEPPGRFLFLTNDSSDNAPRYTQVDSKRVFKKISEVILAQRGKPPRGESSGNGGRESSMIDILRDNDILLGCGKGRVNHPGNVKFREFCWNARELFNRASSPYVE
jgi:hypothetical protein